MSKVGDQYQVHESLKEARDYELENTGATHWHEEERNPADLKLIALKTFLLLGAFIMPVLLCLATFKWIYRVFILTAMLFLSVETSAQPVQRSKISGVGILLAGGAAYGWLHKRQHCIYNKHLYSNKTLTPRRKFNPVRK